MRTKKKFDSVKMMRNIRDEMSREIANMDSKQLMEYFRKGREEFEKKYGKHANKSLHGKRRSRKFNSKLSQ